MIQRILGSIVVLEEGFEPIVYRTRGNALNDSLKYFEENFHHHYHPLTQKKPGSDNDRQILQRRIKIFNKQAETSRHTAKTLRNAHERG